MPEAIRITTGEHRISGAWVEAAGPLAGILLLAHGAGARRDHPSMLTLAASLSEHGFRSFLFNFPYTEAGRRRPDPAPTLIQTWIDVLVWARRSPDAAGVPLLAGGRSMGGRMASLAAARHPDSFDPSGLVFFAYPLHPSGRTGKLRDAHLPGVRAPMLFLSGTRDTLAKVELMDAVTRRLGGRTRLKWIEGADHGYHVLKRSGRTDEDVREEAAGTLRAWCREMFQDRQDPGREGKS